MKLLQNFSLKLKHDQLLIIVLIAVSIVNFLITRFSLELISFQYLLVITLFKPRQLKKFVTAWTPLFLFLLLHYVLRSIADNISPTKDQSLLLVYALEKKIFIVLPTTWLQSTFKVTPLLNSALLIIYSSYFYFSFLVGLLIFLFKYNYFSLYKKTFIQFTIPNLVLFFLLPTSPPWLVGLTNQEPITRIIFDSPILYKINSGTFIPYVFYDNAVAAFPSLHFGWPFFTCMFLIQAFGKKFIPLLILPILMAVTLIYSGEHFVLDILGSLALWLIIFFTQRLFQRRGRDLNPR